MVDDCLSVLGDAEARPSHTVRVRPSTENRPQPRPPPRKLSPFRILTCSPTLASPMRETFSSQVFLPNSSRAAWSEDYIHLDLPWVTAQIRSVLGISGNSQVSQKTSSKKLGKRKTASLEPATLQDRKRVKLDENLESFSPPFWTHSTELRFQKEQPLGGLSQNEAELIAAVRLLSESSQDQVLLGNGYITHLPGDDAGVYLR